MADTDGYNRATIADVAARAGVSIATVSRVMNGTAPVADSTAERVREAITALQFTPHAAARGLASRRTQTLGLIVPEISGAFFQPMLKGIEAGAREHGFDLLVYASDVRAGRHPLGEHNCDGLLVFTDSLSDTEIMWLYRAQFPLVLLNRSAPKGALIPCVTYDNRDGTRQLIEYLILERGFHRIAFLRGPEGNEDGHWREVGYRDALAAHHIPFDEALVGLGGFHEMTAYQTVRGWIERGLHIDAIFTGDDDSALGVLASLRDAGLSVPDSVAVVGFDDIPVARHVTPALTTVRAPIEQAGREGVRRLTELIRSGQTALTTVLPTELIIRRSCGATR